MSDTRESARPESLTLAEVLQMLADTCREKAAHLRSEWQDEITARAWERAARSLDRAITHPAVVIISHWETLT